MLESATVILFSEQYFLKLTRQLVDFVSIDVLCELRRPKLPISVRLILVSFFLTCFYYPPILIKLYIKKGCLSIKKMHKIGVNKLRNMHKNRINNSVFF